MVKPEQKKILVAGGAGFIGSHLAKRLKDAGHYVVAADWNRNEYFDAESDFCDKFLLMDLRDQENCHIATEGCDEVYDLAADMGGMGFIMTNHALILQNNLRIGLNLLASATKYKVKKFFFASSACVYPDYRQEETHVPALKESDAYPSDLRSNAYGFEKLVMEEATRWTAHDTDIKIRIGRFHNIYGPKGTWKGGREKAPAAFCRKIIANDTELEVWGDGEQTRSFCLVDDCVEGVIRLMNSDYTEPLNIGSDRLISMNDMAKLIMTFEGKNLTLKHLKGPQGVRGRNSDNTLIKEVLGWAPTIQVEEGLKKTYFWIKEQMEKDRAAGISWEAYKGSMIVTVDADKQNDDHPATSKSDSNPVTATVTEGTV